jgi:hypothetical protein
MKKDIELRPISKAVAKRGSRNGIEAQQRARARGEKIATRPLAYERPTRERTEPVEFGPEANEAMKLLGSLW